jgi:co-chaperonin GroES (HSP10)
MSFSSFVEEFRWLTLSFELSSLQVVATGPGLPHPTTGSIVPPVIKTGDRVLLPAFGGQQIKVEGEEEVRRYPVLP